MESVVIHGIELQLSLPDQRAWTWIGRRGLMHQLCAALSVFDDDDEPLFPRLVGKSGVGKTTLAAAAAGELGLPLYMMQVSAETRPEDLLVMPVSDGDRRLRYVASPLVSAMIRGGLCVLDEANRMGERCWSSMVPLFDRRRYIESVSAGLRIEAHPAFRLCATMADDPLGFELPDAIAGRMQPRIVVEFADHADERAVLERYLPVSGARIVEYLAAFLQRAHEAEAGYTTRDGINVGRYATKLARAQRDRPGLDELRFAAAQILGDGAMRLLPGGEAVIAAAECDP